MRQILVVAVVMALTFGILPAADAAVSEGFDNFESGVRPRGWTFTYCSKNSDAEMTKFGVAAPSVTMDAYGDFITTIQFNQSGAGTVQFWAGALADNPSSALLVRDYDGAAWTRLTLLIGSEIPWAGGTIGPLALNPSGSQQVDFHYKDTGNNTSLYLDDVVITDAATPEPTAAPAVAPTPVYLVKDWDDYDGDGSTDVAVIDTSTGEWKIEGVTDVVFGAAADDIPAPGDYNGDLTADLAYFNRVSALWNVMDPDGTVIATDVAWGSYGDIPVPGDYDGDGTTDYATWGSSDGRWRIKDITNVWYAGDATAYPAPGDYNGDGTTDLAFIQPSNGFWYVKGIGNYAWSQAADIATPMDYDGDGITDVAVYRPSKGKFLIRQSSGGYAAVPVGWVGSSDEPVVADFDGDGAADLAIRRNRAGGVARWWWIPSTTGVYTHTDWGAFTDTIVDGATSY